MITLVASQTSFMLYTTNSLNKTVQDSLLKTPVPCLPDDKVEDRLTWNCYFSAPAPAECSCSRPLTSEPCDGW